MGYLKLFFDDRQQTKYKYWTENCWCSWVKCYNIRTSLETHDYFHRLHIVISSRKKITVGFKHWQKNKVSICIHLSWFFIYGSCYYQITCPWYCYHSHDSTRGKQVQGIESPVTARKFNSSVFHTSVKISDCFI